VRKARHRKIIYTICMTHIFTRLKCNIKTLKVDKNISITNSSLFTTTLIVVLIYFAETSVEGMQCIKLSWYDELNSGYCVRVYVKFISQ